MDIGQVVLFVLLCAGAVLVPLVKFWLNPGRPSTTRDLEAGDPSGQPAAAMHFTGNDSGGAWTDSGSGGGDGGGASGGDGGGGSW